MDCSPPDSSFRGILQARILEWVAVAFSRGSSWPGDQTQASHIASRCFTLWSTREATELKVKTATWTFWTFSSHFWTNKPRRELLGWLDQGKTGLLLHDGGKEESIWNTTDPQGHLLVLLCPVIKINRNLLQHNSGRTTNSLDPSGMKLNLHTTQGIERRPAEFCWRAKIKLKGECTKVVKNTSYDHMTSYRNEDHNHEYLFWYEHACVYKVNIFLFLPSLISWSFNRKILTLYYSILSIHTNNITVFKLWNIKEKSKHPGLASSSGEWISVFLVVRRIVVSY